MESTELTTRATFGLIAVFRSLFQVLLCFTDLQKCSFHTLIDFRLTSSCKEPSKSRKTAAEVELTVPTPTNMFAVVFLCVCVRVFFMCVFFAEHLEWRHLAAAAMNPHKGCRSQCCIQGHSGSLGARPLTSSVFASFLPPSAAGEERWRRTESDV